MLGYIIIDVYIMLLTRKTNYQLRHASNYLQSNASRAIGRRADISAAKTSTAF